MRLYLISIKPTYSTLNEEETPSPRLGVTHSWSSRGGSLLKRTSGESLMKDFYIRNSEGHFLVILICLFNRRQIP